MQFDITCLELWHPEYLSALGTSWVGSPVRRYVQCEGATKVKNAPVQAVPDIQHPAFHQRSPLESAKGVH